MLELLKVKFTGKLKNQQNKAVNALLGSTVGILEASTGFGKTITALALIAKRKVNTLIPYMDPLRLQDNFNR